MPSDLAHALRGVRFEIDLFLHALRAVDGFVVTVTTVHPELKRRE